MNNANVGISGKIGFKDSNLSGKKIQARAIESDNKMVEHAIILLSDGGVSSVTLEAVGVNAGYSRGLVTRRYGSKTGLLIRILNNLEGWLDMRYQLATKGKYGVDAIISMFMDVAENINENKEKYRAYFWLRFYGLESNEELNHYLIEAQKNREKELQKWLKEALVLEQISRNSDIEMMADFIMTTMVGLINKWMIDPEFNIGLRLNQFVKIQLKLMFANSHLYYSVKYWGE